VVLQTYDCNCDSTIKPLQYFQCLSLLWTDAIPCSVNFSVLPCPVLSRSVPVNTSVHPTFDSQLKKPFDSTTPDHTRPPSLASPGPWLPEILVVTSFPRPLYSALRGYIRSVGLSSFLILLATGSPVVAREIDRMHGILLGNPRRYYWYPLLLLFAPALPLPKKKALALNIQHCIFIGRKTLI